jgi:MscS family membrane protein
MLSSILNKLVSAIDGVENEHDMIIRLIVAVAVFALMIVFRTQISKFIVMLFNKIFVRKSVDAQRAVKESLTKPLSIFIVVMALFISTEIVAPTGEIRSISFLIFKLGLIIFIGWFGVNFINSEFTFFNTDESSKTRKTAIKFISNILKVAIVIIAVLLCLEQFGISATKIFAALGIGGVAVAFACKDAVENMLSGFIIIFNKPFEVDDAIEIEGTVGTVEDITIRTTKLRAVDGSEKIYPNTVMANAAITNWSKIDKRSFDETLWINYKHSDDDIEKYCHDIREILMSNESVIKDDVRVNFTEYGTHALEINLFCYINKPDKSEYLKVKNDINLAIKNYADNSNMELAFSSQTLYFGDELNIKSRTE